MRREGEGSEYVIWDTMGVRKTEQEGREGNREEEERRIPMLLAPL
jgi:antirestriction protein ArdC